MCFFWCSTLYFYYCTCNKMLCLKSESTILHYARPHCSTKMYLAIFSNNIWYIVVIFFSCVCNICCLQVYKGSGSEAPCSYQSAEVDRNTVGFHHKTAKEERFCGHHPADRGRKAEERIYWLVLLYIVLNCMCVCVSGWERTKPNRRGDTSWGQHLHVCRRDRWN